MIPYSYNYINYISVTHYVYMISYKYIKLYGH